MNKRLKNTIICCLLVVFIFFLIYAIFKINNYSIQVNSNENSNSLNNKKIGWGIRRGKNNEQPDLGKENIENMKKHGGYAIGNKENKSVYLTFDEGYEAGFTERLLEILNQNDVKAAFFITAHYLNSQEDLVKKIIDQGHIIGNHTVNHKSMPDLSDDQVKEEIMRLHKGLFDKFKYEMKYFRPPRGEYSERTLAITKGLGYKTVMWSFAYEDFNERNQKSEEFAKKIILDNIHNGSIILLHGNSKTNTDVLDEVIKEIKNRGYEFKSLDEFEL